MPNLPAKIAAIALIVALCALRCTCGCMSDSLGSYLGHAAAPTHDCCHTCDDASPTSDHKQPVHHDSCCDADDRVPAPATPTLEWPQAIAALIVFPHPIQAAAPPERSLAAADHPPALAARSLLRLHCALTI